MKYIKVSIRNHRKLYSIILASISIGVTLGLIISLTLSNEIVNSIYNYYLNYISSYNNHILSNIFYPIIIYIVIFILSITILGFFIPIFSLFIENISIGLIIGVLIRIKAFKGFLFGIIYFIITKFIYLIILIYIVISIYKFLSIFIESLHTKKECSIYKLYSNILLKLLVSLVAVTSYNLLNIFIAPKLIEFFSFLL